MRRLAHGMLARLRESMAQELSRTWSPAITTSGSKPPRYGNRASRYKRALRQRTQQRSIASDYYARTRI